MKPATVAQIHREICEREKCDQLDNLNFADECAACPNGHWGRYTFIGCDDPDRVTPAPLAPVEPTPLQPGSLFGAVIFKLTSQQTANCGKCGARKATMNKWGWFGCWRNRKVIIGWLIEEAAARGHVIGESEMFSLFRAAIKELRK